MNIRRLEGETLQHFTARRILFRYISVIYSSEKNVTVLQEYPAYKPIARADLAVVELTPPRSKIRVWVEAQETHLSQKAWKEKLANIEKLGFKELWVALTEDLADDLRLVWEVLIEVTRNFKLFLVHTKTRELYRIVIQDKEIEQTKLLIDGNKVIRKKMKKYTLDDIFFRGETNA